MVSRGLEEVDRTFDVVLGDCCSFDDVGDVVAWEIDCLELTKLVVGIMFVE